MIGLIGIKEGMSRVFTEDVNSVPVTVVKIDSNVVTQIKKINSEGYSSVQISTGTKKEKHLTKPEKAHLNKSNTPSAKTIKEFRIQESDLENIELGQSLELNMFEESDYRCYRNNEGERLCWDGQTLEFCNTRCNTWKFSSA